MLFYLLNLIMDKSHSIVVSSISFLPTPSLLSASYELLLKGSLFKVLDLKPHYRSGILRYGHQEINKLSTSTVMTKSSKYFSITFNISLITTPIAKQPIHNNLGSHLIGNKVRCYSHSNCQVQYFVRNVSPFFLVIELPSLFI